MSEERKADTWADWLLVVERVPRLALIFVFFCGMQVANCGQRDVRVETRILKCDEAGSRP